MLLFCARDDDGRNTGMQKKSFKISILTLLAGVATYSLAGFLLAPHMVKYWIENSVATEPGFELGVAGVYVNPFTLFISLTNVTLFDPKNKPTIVIARVETSLPIMQKLRRSRAGYDVEMHDLRVTNPSAGAAALTIPGLSATGLAVNAAQGSISVDDVRLRNPEFRITRNAEVQLLLPAWLPLPWSDAPMATVLFETIEVTGGTIRFTDPAVSPALQLVAGDIAGNIRRRRVAGAASIAVALEGRFDKSGSIEVSAEWPLSNQRGPTTVNLALREVELSAVSPYFARIAGRGIVAGTGELTLHYEHRDSAVRANNRMVIDRLQFDDRAITDTGVELPLNLAVALVTDERDRIDISIPMLHSGADVDAAHVIVDSLTSFIRELAATPFDVLAVLVGRENEELGRLAFPPGSADLTPATAEKIALLTRALTRRPLLGLRTFPAYDPAADRDAIAARQVRLHVSLATSAAPSGLAAQTQLDFDDPKVRAILDEFAGARLRESRRNAILNRFDDKDSAYYRAVFDALIANEIVSETALRRLARFRATSVTDAFASNGIDEGRVLPADEIETTTTDPGAVVVRLEAVRQP
jgi:hypothetical protein